MPAEVLYAIDLDKTSIDTHMAVDVLYLACEDHGINVADIAQARRVAEASGISFDPLSFMAEAGYEPDVRLSVVEDFIELAKDHPLLIPDAKRFLDRLEAMDAMRLILTQGGVDWQMAKIMGSGLGDMEVVVTDRVDKGELIASWSDGENYSVETIGGKLFVAKSVVLAEDKEIAVVGLPDDCVAYLRQPDSQTPSIPARPNIIRIQSFDQIAL